MAIDENGRVIRERKSQLDQAFSFGRAEVSQPATASSSSLSGISNTSGFFLGIIAIVIAVLWIFWGRGKQIEPAHVPFPTSQSRFGPSAKDTSQNPLVAKAELIDFVRSVVSANFTGIESVLEVARGTSGNAPIALAAKTAGRSFSFAPWTFNRDRKRARLLNERALTLLNQRRDVHKACQLLDEGFFTDPLDVEIVGNLAICRYMQNRIEDARQFALYALSLPRTADKTGRTADWTTLAASYAASGDHQRSKDSLYVTLGITSDIAKRCHSAVYSVRNIYGATLNAATEAMFERIKANGLSSATECSLPIAW